MADARSEASARHSVSTSSVAGLALTTAALFLALVAVLIGAPALFYMGTALFTMIGACQVQAWLSVRGLRFERVAPESARVGDLLTVEITVWSERKIRRPLVTILDHLPGALALSHRSPSLPIAPAYDLPIRTQYQFRPTKRGVYRWSGLTAQGTDALGLVTRRRLYQTAPAELTVLPRPIPVSVELPNAAGWGISEAESGQTRGAGIEPRGIRGYVSGDSLRHIHWRSSAKTGQLLVKEFEAGSQAAAAFLIQRTRGTEVGQGAFTSLEAMVGHAVFLAETFLRQGARIELPGLENRASHHAPHERQQEIYEAFATLQADHASPLASEVMAQLGLLPPGSVLFAFLAVQDPALPEVVTRLDSHGTRVVALLYDAGAFWVPQKSELSTFLAGQPFFRQDPDKLWPQPKGRTKASSPLPSATEPEYIEALRRAGATTVVMPTEVPE